MVYFMPMNNDFNFHKNRPSLLHSNIPFGVAIFIMLFLSGIVIWGTLDKAKNILEQNSHPAVFIEGSKANVMPEVKAEAEWNFVPGPISMSLIKNNGCVADGFLSGYGGKTTEMIKMINRSNCVYLHRALETWLRPPDFDKAVEIMRNVDKKQVVYGMFIAEAASMQKTYRDPIKDKKYHFSEMCREGTENQWGNGTCVPSIQNVEYRRYLQAVTHRAIDTGIQSFLFGQIKLQDEHPNFEETEIKKVLDDMRRYAKEKNVEVIIGAQTDDIVDEKYLRLFDYIEGGVGIDSQGQVENQACSSKFSSCWALLWDKQYSSRANNVLLHLDWSGFTWDDMSIFAKMPQDRRISTLTDLYQKFTVQNMGFMMPFLAVLNHDNEGCYGPNKNFYTPSQKYKCKDEGAINKIMPKLAP